MISQPELRTVFKILLAMAEECDANLITRPKLRIDQITFNDLDNAMTSRWIFGEYGKDEHTFFSNRQPKLLGFKIEVVDG